MRKSDGSFGDDGEGVEVNLYMSWEVFGMVWEGEGKGVGILYMQYWLGSNIESMCIFPVFAGSTLLIMLLR